MKKGQCIVLDLDSTLIRTLDSMEMDNVHKEGIFTDGKYINLRSMFYSFDLREIVKEGKIENQKICGVTRPHLRTFLNYCKTRFDIVAIWTAGTYKYGHGIVECIFDEIMYPHQIFTRDQCVGPMENLEKPIKKMIEKTPGLSNYMTLENTFIIDDRKCSILPNYENGILIPEFKPSGSISSLLQPDNALLNLMKWFDKPEVINCTDIRSLPKHSIFDEYLSFSSE